MTIPIIARAHQFADRTAAIAAEGQFTYQQLLDVSGHVASTILDGQTDMADKRVAFLTSPSMAYLAVQWGAWRAGAMAVPLCTQHPEPELDYVIEDAGAEIVIAAPEFADRLKPIAQKRGLRFMLTTDLMDFDSPAADDALPDVDSSRPAMLVYTSGTTNRPKGAVITHDNIAAQVTSLVEAWGWTQDDHILEVLPLHHVHGIVNVVACALWSGAKCELLPKFDADLVWQRLIDCKDLTLFMAVPTIYARLIKAWDSASPEQQQAMTEACRKLRLMVSGSAALPVTTLEKWRTVSGHTLLERYGMTEIGMGLSNPLHGERCPGRVGSPLPRVQVRLVDEAGKEINDGQSGQIQIKGPAVFKEYWRKPEATADAFTEDGWFKTGDVAICEDNIYRILGRNSVDIIKTGGYKVSALEIEASLRDHNAIDECAVVGVPDDEWGQRVGVAIICANGHSIDLDTLRVWAKERLATYKVPSLLRVVEQLPRNPIGKVTKPAVVELFQDAAQEQTA